MYSYSSQHHFHHTAIHASWSLSHLYGTFAVLTTALFCKGNIYQTDNLVQNQTWDILFEQTGIVSVYPLATILNLIQMDANVIVNYCIYTSILF